MGARKPSAAGPRRDDVGVLALVPDRWDAPWQSRHHVLSRLARTFRVVWVEPARRLRAGSAAGRPARSGTRDVAPGLVVYSPEVWLPLLYRPRSVARLVERLRLRRALRSLRARGCRTTVLYLWRPEFADALDLVPHDLSCYHIDDEYRFTDRDEPTDPAEAALIARVDQVFIHSRTLLQKKGGLNPYTRLVPNGVDFAAYVAPLPEPADLAAVPRPRIGYTGFLKKQLDWDLLEALIARHPEWSFVFVGPESAHAEVRASRLRLAGRANAHFLGGKPAPELAAYAQHVDVCTMPYRITGYTKYIFPMKLHEYLAAGTPVVGTPIPALEEFADVVSLATTADEWSGALRHALGPDSRSAAQREARRAVARRYDWDGIVDTLAETLRARLDRESESRRGPSSPSPGITLS